MQTESGWTSPRTASLRTHWDNGLSASQIARKMKEDGFAPTRNAVIGKVHRLGLAGRARDPAANHRKGTKTRAPKPVPAVRLAKLAAPAAPPPPPPPPIEGAKTVAEKGRFDCSWVVAGEGVNALMCCAPVVGSTSYCAFHKSVAYQPQKKANRTTRLNMGAQSGAPLHGDFGVGMAA